MAPSFDGRSNWALLVAGGLATHISSFSPFMRLNTKQIDSPFGRQNLIIQEIQVNVKRLGRQFWRCWHCLWGSSSRPRCFLGEPTTEPSPWQPWRCYAGESIGKQLSHQAGAAGGQEYTLDTDALQTLARFRETETSSRTKQSLGRSHWAKW